MATDSNDVQAIEKISAVVGESQVKIILSNQCIKAQTLLVNRLKKQFERQKEICKFISSDNLKLEAEIKNAEQEIKSLMLAHESIKSANVELKKEWQLAKERTQENIERMRSGERKYEELWEQCKTRYESIGFVQNWLQANKKHKDLTENNRILENKTQELFNEIKTKEDIISEVNKQRIIKLADYLIHEKPKTMENISKKSVELKELKDQFEQLIDKQKAEDADMKDTSSCISDNPQTKAISSKLTVNMKVDNDWPNLNKNFNNNGDSLMPKLQLMNIDLDMLSFKLDQIKKSDLVATSPMKEAIPASTGSKDTVMDKGLDEHVSTYFNQPESHPAPADENKHDKCENYSKRKLINILDDIKLNKNEVFNLVTNVNLNNLKGVDVISGNGNKIIEGPPEFLTEKVTDGIQDVQIKEIVTTSSNAENILMPPSGFLDQLRSSQEKKKKVSFELPITMQELATEARKEVPMDIVEDANDTLSAANSLMEDSAVSDESFTNIKNMILKKHNLDLSPQFVYGKNTVVRKNEETVKSNYFKLSNEELPSISGTCFDREEAKVTEITETDENEINIDRPPQNDDAEEPENKSVEMEVPEENISSLKAKQGQINRNPVAGLLFSHGAHGIPDSLDVSISTTGFEEGDTDFPQYSSLLLSPRADLPIPADDKPDITSQEVPNFLSGLRKTGLSFFGKMTAPDSANTEPGPSEGNNFNFTFGTDDKKTRGGIFNMFN